MTIKQVLKAIECFILINTLELTNPEMEYVERLSLAVQKMKGDEVVFDCFSNLFENDRICKVMIMWLDARY